jgi:hypothetical protein
MLVAYYSRPDGKVEKLRMHHIDYAAAVKREPHAWDLHPRGGEIIDRTGEWGDPAYVTSGTAPKVSERENLRAGTSGPRA